MQELKEENKALRKENQEFKKITRESSTWAKNKENNVDYILYFDILPEGE